MKFVALCSIVFMAAIGIVGCGSLTSPVLNENGMPLKPPKAQTLEQAKKDMPFSVIIPDQLPHDMRFWYPLEEVNPNTNKPDHVYLMFSSPDRKYGFNVDERAMNNGMEQPAASSKIVEINGYKGFIDRTSKGAFITWNNGKVVFHLDTGPNTGDQELIEIAKSFK